MTQLINKAAAGDARATQQVIAIRKMMGETEQIQGVTAVTDELDRQVMQQIIARIRRTDQISAERQHNPIDVTEPLGDQIDVEACATVTDEPSPSIEAVAPLFPERGQEPGTEVNANKRVAVHE